MFLELRSWTSNAFALQPAVGQREFRLAGLRHRQRSATDPVALGAGRPESKHVPAPPAGATRPAKPS